MGLAGSSQNLPVPPVVMVMTMAMTTDGNMKSDARRGSVINRGRIINRRRGVEDGDRLHQHRRRCHEHGLLHHHRLRVNDRLGVNHPLLNCDRLLYHHLLDRLDLLHHARLNDHGLDGLMDDDRGWLDVNRRSCVNRFRFESFG